VGLAAGFMNVMAGGGSAITLSALIFLGLDPTLANGTNRIAITIQNLSAVYSFKEEKYQNFKLSFKLALLTLPGAIIGAFAAVKIDDEIFQTILGIIMIFIIISMIVPKKKIDILNSKTKTVSAAVYIAMFFIGFYGGFIQAGVGFLIMAALNYLMKLDLVHVNMHKVFIVLIYTLPALLIFVLSGNVNWKFGISLSAGNAIGGWWAAKFSIKKGEKIIRVILIFTILIMALKMLKVF
jgi:uncharacterized protein